MDYNKLFNQLVGQPARSAPIVNHISYDDMVEERGDDDPLVMAFQERVGLNPNGMFLFRVVPSTQALDGYGTRMRASSIKRYAGECEDGVPFMNAHRTGGWFETAELPLGYSFFGKTVGKPVREDVLLEGDDREVDLFDPGLSVEAWDYMARDHYPNGNAQPGTNDIIRAVETKTLRSVSIGFGRVGTEGVRYTCGLCGKEIGWGWYEGDQYCDHVPLVKDRETGLTAFAWVEASMKEHSAVWKGATPGAVILGQARAAMRRGDLTSEEIDFLQEAWQVKLFDREMFMVNGQRDEDVVEPAVEADLPEAERDDKVLEAVEKLTDLVTGLADDLEKVRTMSQRALALSKVAAESPRPEDIPDALVEDVIEARVRAMGPGTFDEDTYREALESAVDFARAELAAWQKKVKRDFEPGSVTAKLRSHEQSGSFDSPQLSRL